MSIKFPSWDDLLNNYVAFAITGMPRNSVDKAIIAKYASVVNPFVFVKMTQDVRTFEIHRCFVVKVETFKKFKKGCLDVKDTEIPFDDYDTMGTITHNAIEYIVGSEEPIKFLQAIIAEQITVYEKYDDDDLLLRMPVD